MFYFGELARITLYYIGVEGIFIKRYIRNITKTKYYLHWLFDTEYSVCFTREKGYLIKESLLAGCLLWNLYGPANAIYCNEYAYFNEEQNRLYFQDFSTTKKNKIINIREIQFDCRNKNEWKCEFINLICSYYPCVKFSFDLSNNEVDIRALCVDIGLSKGNCGHCMWPLPREYLR